MMVSIDTFMKDVKECVENVKNGETIIVVGYDGTIIEMKKV